MSLPDHDQRQQAIDIRQSFIVQAPAGSGKTELLTRRFLALLEVVEKPEEILAITFTRKAAEEMQNRVNRLNTRIQTIDSFCAFITRQMPISSGLGIDPTILDNPEYLYRRAAKATLATLEEDHPWVNALATLLLHLNNDLPYIERLFIDMLARRDQWMPYLLTVNREKLEENLRNLIKVETKKLDERFSPQNWKELANLLLTKEGGWRKKKALESILPQDEITRQMLLSVRQLPPSRYSDAQWNMVSHLLDIMPVLVAKLKLIFQEEDCVDHAEIALSALQALGDTDNPTDLALKLDYRIKHILVDEFQDTSSLQFELLEKLISGWQPGDGRTLFLVGDPMQSIYRFRKAEVNLFFRAQQQGIGSVSLTPLTLCTNFRSQAGIVEWINATFSRRLPNYASSVAIKPTNKTPAVQLYTDDMDCISIIQNTDPGETLGLLVRSRTHLKPILPALRIANITYRAVELESLLDRMVVHDLLALTRALVDLTDRTAWLAILRSPWCKLSLADLYTLSYDHSALLWHQIQYYEPATHIRAILMNALAQRESLPLHRLVEETWNAFGGPTSQEELDDGNAFFQLLSEMSGTAITEFEKKLQTLYVSSDTHDNSRVEIMTLHKAKGLEFDTVIIPSLGKKSRPNPQPLLIWTDQLLAPIPAVHDDPDPIYQYLRREETKKDREELIRLFYVGATRARHALHLIAHNPAPGSILDIYGEPLEK